MDDALAAAEIAVNRQQRCACILLVDTSGSMNGPKIEELNEGLRTLKDEMAKDEMASLRVDLAVMTFDSEVKLAHDFATPLDFEPPELTAQNQTFMGTAILDALDQLSNRRRQYRDNAVGYYRSWLFLITDGNPEGEPDEVIERAKAALKKAKEKKLVHVFAVGVGDQVDLQLLGDITDTTPLRLKGTKFAEMFKWLSVSLTSVSRSKTDDDIQLPVPKDWATIQA
jgi:uncharacterized protein YegL